MPKESGPTKKEVAKVLAMFAADDAIDDTNIESYFIQTESFQQLSPDKSYVIVGHYGSGKTALIRHLVRQRRRRLGEGDVIPISLRADLFGEELRSANTSEEYGTFAQALVYLHTLYRLAESASGTLTTGDKAALIKELHALKLQPYGDLISRLADAVGHAVKKVRKLDIAKAFNIELHESKAEEINMARYRQMCLTIAPLVRKQFAKRKPIIIIDELDAPSRLAKQTAALVGVLIRWLKEVGRSTEGAMQFLIGLPTNLFQVGRNTGEIYTPSQEMFTEIDWTPDELEKLVTERVRTGLGSNVAPADWLETACSLRFAQLHRFTFGRPRNYVQLVRTCLEVKLSNLSRSPNECRNMGLRRYARQTLRWLQSEWQGTNEGFKDLVDLLLEFDDSVTATQLKSGIGDIRKRGILKQCGVNSVIRELEQWHLIKREGTKKRDVSYTTHPIIKLAGEFTF